LRHRLLIAYADRVASPRELADELGEPLTSVSYHTQRLLGHGLVELVRTEPRRGATMHFYRAAVRHQFDDEQWQGIPPAVRRSIAGEVIAHLWDELSAAIAGGALEADDLHVSRQPLELDEAGRAELAEMLRRLNEEGRRIERDSRARLAEDSPAPRRSTLAVLLFDQA
jgi:DNA-binding transcriptional ArsR family regulator